MKFPDDVHALYRQTLSGMRTERYPWWQHWRDCADYILPRRYLWLMSPTERTRASGRNPYILDSTGTGAARTLASGMMNGITSPARPWFRLRLANFADDLSSPARVWLDEVTRRLLLIMAESNFYNSLATLYLDLVVFGTAAMLIYEDDDKVIHCHTPALGEFYLMQSSQHRVNGLAREFWYKVHQVVGEFGEDNCSETVKQAWKRGGAQRMIDIPITHLIQPNTPNDKGEYRVDKSFKFVECYWETSGPLGTILRQSGYKDFPAIAPRWELSGNDAYGSSPGMDALGDIIQLQHETKKKAQGLDYMMQPPIVADIQLQHRPTALLPRGITYVHGSDRVGAKPLYTVNPPLGEMSADLRDIQARIRETFHNPLFNKVTSLDTVRSAREIDAIEGERLVLLGPVLERFENEALDPSINRVYQIANRKGLLPPPPPDIGGADLEIQYVSIMSAAQAAVGTASTERWLQLIAGVAPLFPDVVEIPDIVGTIRDYGRDVGVPAKNIRSVETIEGIRAEKNAAAQRQTAITQGAELAPAAKALSESEVGGGANVLQRLLGG